MKKIINEMIVMLLVHVTLPAGLFTMVWNNIVADTFNAAHFNFWTFFVICLGMRYLFPTREGR